MSLTRSRSKLPGVCLALDLGFLSVNIRHDHSFDGKKKNMIRQNLNNSDRRQSVHNMSVPKVPINLGTYNIYVYFKGCWIFSVAEQLLSHFCYYYSICKYKQYNYGYSNPLEFILS